MKLVRYSFVLVLLCFSCKTKKNMINENAVAKEISAKRAAKKHNAAAFDKKSVDAKLKVNFDNEKTKQSLSVQLKIEKDEVIYLKGTKFITVFKAKITPTSVSYYSPLAKNYFTGDFSMIKEFLGVEINFEQLQNLFLGQTLANLKEDTYNIEIIDNSYVLTPEQQNKLFAIFYAINPSHFKLDKQFLVDADKKMRLDIIYPSYDLKSNTVFPNQINIIAKNEKSTTTIELEYKSVEFNTDATMSFDIPNGYKRIEF